MKCSPEYPPAYRPADYVRGYSHEVIADHLNECLAIYAELASEYESEIDGAGIPPEIRASVFAVVQTMVASVEPSPEKMRELQAAAKIVGGGNGLSVLGG